MIAVAFHRSLRYFINLLLSPVLVLAFICLPVQAAEPSPYGGQLILSTVSDPKSFNDILAKETSSTLVTSLIFEGLTKTNAHTTKVEPLLAEKWTVSDDGLVWMFHLRQDVRWQDGVPFTADDVVFTFNDLIFNPDVPSSAKDVFTIEGKPFNVDKVDTHTVRVTLPVKFAPFLRGMSQAILPKHLLEESVKKGNFSFTWGIDTDPEKIIGTGAYRLVEYTPSQRLVFERNPDYWQIDAQGNRRPYIDKLIYMIVQDTNVQLRLFWEGNLDAYALGGLEYPMLKPIGQDKDFTIYDLGPDTGSNFVSFNLNPGVNPKTKEPFVDPVKLSWFQNLKFRKAVAHAIDKQKIIEIVKNRFGYAQHSPIGPGAGYFHNPDVTKYEFDLEKAKKILADAGFRDRNGDGFIEDPKGNTVEFNLTTNSNSPDRVDIAAIIRHDLEQIGMKVNFRSIEFNTLVSQLTSTFGWEAIVLGLTGGIEPHFGKNVWHSTGGLHLWHPRQEKPATSWEKRIDEIFSRGVQELNEERRKVLYDEFQQIVSDQLPVIYTVLGAKMYAVKNKFENLQPTNYGGVFHNLEELIIRPEKR